MGLRHTHGSLNLGLNSRLNNNQQKKRTSKIVDIAVPADHKIKLKECKKIDKYFDLARKLKKTVKHAGDNYGICNWCVWNSN